jgi:hypothetical protein
MEILVMIHSYLRWAILLVAAIALVKFAFGWFGKKPFDKMANGLSAGFSGLMDLQATLGLALFLWSGVMGAGFPRHRWEHMTAMIIAAFVGHLYARFRKSDDAVRYRNGLIIIIVTLLLVVAGIMVLPGGAARWDFRF